MALEGVFARRPLRLLMAAAAILLLSLAALASVQIYRAEKLSETGAEQDLRKAVQLTPANASAWARLGALLQRRGDNDAAARALERAVELNRYDGGAWVSLGVHWELEGDPQRAERCLLEAARVDRTFYPHWALANFYLRQGSMDRFWPAIRQSISSSRSDLNSVFDLCWRAIGDPEEILQKGIPDTGPVNRTYWAYLMQSGRTAAVAGVWQRLASRLQASDLQPALGYVNALVAGRRVDAAIRVWNRLCEARLQSCSPLDPARGLVLTNADFRLPLSGAVFDWRSTEVAGIATDVETAGSGSGLRIRFSGAHPEAADLLAQTAPALPNQTYQLKCSYLTTGLPPDTGLSWRVEDAADQAVLLAGLPLPAAEGDWNERSARLQTRAATRLITLVLAYRRSPGTTRAQGSLALRRVDLAPTPRAAP